MDRTRIEAYLRWTTRRFKSTTVERIWGKIQENPKIKREYETFDKQPDRYAHSTANLKFVLKNYGWQDLMKGLFILATEKENSMFLNGLKTEQEKWIKVKDKLAQMPRNVQQ
jgi:hypothetical protein